MKILHYALGFPPYRSGGLTRYVADLIDTQQSEGDAVGMLWPGVMRSRKPAIRKHGMVRGAASFELRNPLPVVLDQAVGNPDEFHYPVDPTVFRNFLVKYRPDIIHFHTLQGLYREFVDTAADLGIPTVFTTHDFFGLYPMNKVYPMDHNLNDEECTWINADAPSLRKLKMQQSTMIRWIKSSNMLRRLLTTVATSRKSYAPNVGETAEMTANKLQESVKNYTAFRAYEVNIINSIDMLLFNSKVSQTAYERYCIPKASMILPITHSNLPTQRDMKLNDDKGQIRIAYLGGTRPYKGYVFLLEVIDKLRKNSSSKLHFDIYGVNGNNDDLVSYLPKFTTFSAAMSKEDVVVVPSMSYESFGFVVLEALSAGIPVIASDCVGASYLIDKKFGYIYPSGNADALSKTLYLLNSNEVEKKCASIKQWFNTPQFNDHVFSLKVIYNKLINMEK